jgi:methyltransferase
MSAPLHIGWCWAWTALLAVQRIVELRLSAENERALVARGGIVHAPAQLRWMTLLHLAWFASCIAETATSPRAVPTWVAWIAIVFFSMGQGLRWLAIHTLGPRWTVSVVTLSGAARVHQGIYRWVAHPNYLGVTLEIAFFPLACGAWWTAFGFSMLNAALLRWRIRTEEHALQAASKEHRGAP